MPNPFNQSDYEDAVRDKIPQRKIPDGYMIMQPNETFRSPEECWQRGKVRKVWLSLEEPGRYCCEIICPIPRANVVKKKERK